MADVYTNILKFVAKYGNDTVFHTVAVCGDNIADVIIAVWGKDGVVFQMLDDGWHLIKTSPKFRDVLPGKYSNWEYSGMCGEAAWTYTKVTPHKWLHVNTEGKRRVFYSARRLRRFAKPDENGFSDFSSMILGQVVRCDLVDMDSGQVVRENNGYVIRIA